MVEKTSDTATDLANTFSQPDGNPLGRLMEQYQRLAEQKSVQERLENAKQEKAADTVHAHYQQYAASYNYQQWWEAMNAANWQGFGAYGMELNSPYLNNINLLQAAAANNAAQGSNLSHLSRLSPNSAASSSPSSGGGKFNRGNCECPNCLETERVGVNNMPHKKRGIHNCHHRGCGKVYNKSSHLKAHLRWHSNDRNTKPRRSGEVV